MRSILLLSMFLVACKPADDAPDDVPVGGTYSLESGPVYLFSGFEGDEAELGQALLDLEAAMETVDLTASAKDRAFTLPKLGAADLGGATAPPGTDPEAQVATVLLARSTNDYDAHHALALETNYVCLESATTVFYGRTVTEGGDCWAGSTCDYLRTTNEVRKENILAKAWYDLFKDYREITLSDGRKAMVARSWTDQVFEGDGGNTQFAQNFTAEAWIPDGDAVLRVYAIWTEINIGLSDDAMQNLVIDGLDEGMGFSDEFLDGVDPLDYCPNDRSRANDRP